MTGRRTALLVATSEFTDDTRQLRERLLESGLDEVVSVVNESKSGIERELERLVRGRSPEDTVLLHVAGSVVRNDYGQSFLATAGSDVTLPYSTAVPVMVVRQLLAECQAQTKIVVLPEDVDLGDGVQVHKATNADEVVGLLSSEALPDLPPVPDFLSLLGISSVAEFDVQHAWRQRPPDELYRAPIGVFDDGRPFQLDIKESALAGMGPHGLLGGATGSGKTELLRILVLGLAATHSPADLNFLLMDTTGRRTFDGLANLPHVSAALPNLCDDVSQLDRVRDAILGEVQRRQDLVKEAGHRNSREYNEARNNGADLAPLPLLVIVVQEFCALLATAPDFADLLVLVARLGRSLAVHMVLSASELPEDGVPGLHALQSYWSYRIGLKMSSEQQSRAALGSAHAAELPPIPGLGLVKTFDTFDRFRTAYVSGPVDGSPSLLDALVAKMVGQAPPPFPVLQPPLEPVYTVDSLLSSLAPGERGLAPTDTRWVGLLMAPVGVVDKPFEQRKSVQILDLGGTAGHAAVVGGPKSGKSTALRTIVLAMALMHTPREVQFHCLDFAGGTLAALKDLPHVGAVASDGQADQVVQLLASVITEREKLFREQNIESIGEFRSRRWQGQFADQPFGDVFLVVDGWRDLPPELAPRVLELVSRGLPYGVHVITSAERWADIPPAAKDMFGTRVELRLDDPGESEIRPKVAGDVPSGRPGRGLTSDKLHIQVGLPRIDGRRSTDDVDAGLRDAVARIRQEWRGPTAAPPPPPPPPSRTIQIGRTTGEHAPVPVTADFDAEPHFLVIGDSESGKTNLLRTIVRGITDRYTSREALIMLVDYRRHSFGFLTSDHLLAYAVMPKQLTEIMNDVVDSLRKRMPGPATTQEQLRDRSWWSGPELFVVVDDCEIVATQEGNPLVPLREFLPHAKDIGLHLVVARRPLPQALQSSDPIVGMLKELATPGVVLSLPAESGPQLGTYRPAPLPAGRGVSITRRTTDQEFQVTWTDPPPR